MWVHDIVEVSKGESCRGTSQITYFTLAFLTASLSLSSATANARRAIPGRPSSSSQAHASCITRTGERRGAPGSSSETMAPTPPLSSVVVVVHAWSTETLFHTNSVESQWSTTVIVVVDSHISSPPKSSPRGLHYEQDKQLPVQYGT